MSSERRIAFKSSVDILMDVVRRQNSTLSIAITCPYCKSSNLMDYDSMLPHYYYLRKQEGKQEQSLTKKKKSDCYEPGKGGEKVKNLTCQDCKKDFKVIGKFEYVLE